MSFNFKAAVSICSDSGAPPKNKLCHCFPIYLPRSDGTRCYDLSLFNTEVFFFYFFFFFLPLIFISWRLITLQYCSGFCHTLSFKPSFSLLFHFHQEPLQFFFTFCQKGGVIWKSEVTDISLCNLDSCMCFIQPRISHGVLCI